MIRDRKMKGAFGWLGAAAVIASSIAASPAVAQRDATRVVDFRIAPAGDATEIVIETTGDIRYTDEFEPLPPRLVVELVGARPSLPLREYQDVYRGGVRFVVVSAPAPDRVRFDFALSGVTSYAIYREDRRLHITFDNPGDPFPAYAADPTGVEGEPRPGEVVERPVRVLPGGATDRMVERAQAVQDEPGLPGIDGRPVSFSFVQTDIQTVIRAFGEVSGRSIVIGRGIAGLEVTADIRNQPWDEALVTLMNAHGLHVELENGIIRVDSVENLRSNEQLVDLATRIVRLNFISAADAVAVVEPLVSERGSVRSDAKTNALVINDVPGRVEQIAGIVNELDIQTPQVTIKAKIVFVNKVDLRDVGVSWRAENLRDPTTDTHALANTDGQIADPFLDLSLGSLASGLNVAGLLQALEQRDMADIQAEPQTTVLNNLPAEVFVGERTPIRVLDIGADTQQAQASVELIETGIILRVTPHITSNGKVLMDLRAERSGVAVTDPAIGVTFNTQRATSQILVDDGETAVIGGLTVQDVSQVRSGIPVLKDIPILGGLFRNETKRSEKRDLLIFVTPYIVPIDQPEPEIEIGICLEDQSWFRADDPILHNGERWLKFGTPERVPARDLVAVGNFRGVTIYTTVESAAREIYLPLCAQGMYQTYRRVPEVRGTTG